MATRLAHLGIAVPHLAEATRAWEALGFEVESRHEVPSEKVRTAFLPVGDAHIGNQLNVVRRQPVVRWTYEGLEEEPGAPGKSSHGARFVRGENLRLRWPRRKADSPGDCG